MQRNQTNKLRLIVKQNLEHSSNTVADKFSWLTWLAIWVYGDNNPMVSLQTDITVYRDKPCATHGRSQEVLGEHWGNSRPQESKISSDLS